MMTQDIYTLKDKISAYRRAPVAKGRDPLKGIVSLMLRTFLGDTVEDVRKIVYDPFGEYLRSAIDLEQLAPKGVGSSAWLAPQRRATFHLRYGIRTVEASAYMQITPALVKFRLSGLDRDARGTLTISNRVLASPNLGGTDHGSHARS
jgi:hypothetical protein